MFTTEPMSHTKKELLKKAMTNMLAVRAELCRRTFYEFVKEFWPEISNDPLQDNWHIQYLCNELQKIAHLVANNTPRPYDLLINIPPGTSKTSICSIMFPVWCWTNWFWMRFITGSYSGALSLESAEHSRDIIRSEKFTQLFPELTIKQDKDTKTNFRVQKSINNQLKYGGTRFSTSTGGTVTGFHGHILLIDDPINPLQAVSEVELKKAASWIGQTLSTRKISKDNTPTIMIMQRLSQGDPSGIWLSNTNKQIKHICLPGEIITKGAKELVKPQECIPYYIDGLLDPSRMSTSALNKLEADLGQYGYAGQVLQNPTPPGGGMFKVAFLNIIDRLPSPVNFVQTVRYWDKAGTTDGGCFTVGVKMSSLKSGKWIIEDVKRFQLSSEGREQIIKSTAHADGTSCTVYVEQEPGSGGKESAQGTIRNLAGFSIYADRPTGDKIFRADPFSVQVNNGNVMMLRGDWNHDFTEEMKFYPFSKYKDQVDAGSGAFNKLVGKKIAGPVTR